MVDACLGRRELQLAAGQTVAKIWEKMARAGKFQRYLLGFRAI
jgi:hypothetical protein